MRGKAPLGTRVLGGLQGKEDWEAFTGERFITFRTKTNRIRSAKIARLVTGRPDRGALMTERTIELPGRTLAIRVHRPKDASDTALPLILQFHGGGFVVGAAAHGDWLNSHVAVQCPAIVASVEYRLAPEHPLPGAIQDGLDTYARMVENAGVWGADPARVAVMGESAGGMIAALIALRARDLGLPLRAQALAYPITDWTDSMLDYPSAAENADNPMLCLPLLRALRRVSLPPSTESRVLSPLMNDDLGGLAPTLIQTGHLDPLDDHGRRYADRLREAGTDTRLSGYPQAPHGFFNMPGLARAAKPARAEMTDFLREHLRAVMTRGGEGARRDSGRSRRAPS